MSGSGFQPAGAFIKERDMARSIRNPFFALLLAWLALAWGAPIPGVQAAGPVVAYRLAETWSDAPWTLQPGHYRDAFDIASAPDGTLYMLDARSAAQMNYPAVHRQIEAKALRKLRHPTRSEKLRSFLDSET